MKRCRLFIEEKDEVWNNEPCQKQTWPSHSHTMRAAIRVAQSHSTRFAEHQEPSEGRRLSSLADLCINKYYALNEQ
ncbi:hypothetical protein Tco_0886171 [Tanacetum coccineum]